MRGLKVGFFLALLLLLVSPAWATTLITAQSLVLTTATPLLKTPDSVLAATTDILTLSLQRPTTLVPMAWASDTTIQVDVVITADGQEYRCTGRATGGIRVDPRGTEIPAYGLACVPTWGFFGATSAAKRLGETATTYTGRLEVRLVAGASAQTIISASTTTNPAPSVAFHKSVAFDAASAVLETSGDGVVSLTHTATGSNLAVFAGSSNYGASAGSNSTSVTYGGTSMTEMWDETTSTLSNLGHAGYQLAGPATGAQTVTNTLVANNPSRHFLQVMSMTGVDQTTPVGTSVTAGPGGITTPASVTVGSVGADDLVVDNFVAYGVNLESAGADQTQRNGIDTDGNSPVCEMRGSTQSGSAGGAMSWTFIANLDWFLGAVAFKPAGATTITPERSKMGVGT